MGRGVAGWLCTLPVKNVGLRSANPTYTAEGIEGLKG